LLVIGGTEGNLVFKESEKGKEKGVLETLVKLGQKKKTFIETARV